MTEKRSQGLHIEKIYSTTGRRKKKMEETDGTAGSNSMERREKKGDRVTKHKRASEFNVSTGERGCKPAKKGQSVTHDGGKIKKVV